MKILTLHTYLLIILFMVPFLGRCQKGLKSEFHKERRNALREKLPPNSVAVFFSAPIRNRSNDVDFEYHQDPNLFYLSGWKEPHAVLVIYANPQTDGEGTYYETMYVRERDAYDELWNGKRKGVKGAKAMGFERAASRSSFSELDLSGERFDTVLFFDFKNDVRDFKKDSYDLYDLQRMFKSKINFPKNFDRSHYQWYQKIRTVDAKNIQNVRSQITYEIEKKPALAEDPIIKQFLEMSAAGVPTELKMKTAFLLKDYYFDLVQLPKFMTELREIKKPEEITLLKKAIRISARGQIEVMKAIHPEMTEREVQGIHQLVFKKYGAAHEGYPSIVGAGGNACVLHYITNDKEDIENQLILMDLGAEYEGYTADVTRTIPVSGRFTEAQKQLYEIVYEAQTAGIKKAVAGGSFKDISIACSKVAKEGLIRLGIIDESGKDFRKYYPHGVAHHIGLDVHDPGMYNELSENMVITVEPGIYIPAGSPCDSKWWDIGIRIEDDVWITSNGPEVLSDEAPRAWKEIEALMTQESPLDDFVLPDLGDGQLD